MEYSKRHARQPPGSESEEIGFDQGLIRPSASSILTRRPPDRVLDGPASCRTQGLRTTGSWFVTHRTYYGLVDGISGISSYDHSLRQRRLRSRDDGKCWPHIRLIRILSTINEGGGSLANGTL